MAGVIEAVLGLRKTKFKAGLNEAKGDAQKFKGEVGGIFAGLGKTIAGALTVTAAIGAFKSLLGFTGDLQDQSDALNANIESLQRYQQVFGQSGTSAESFAKGIGKLNEAVAAALGGDEKKIEQFERMGISLDELAANAGEPINLLPLLADGLEKSADKGGRLSDINDILGKSGKTMAAGLKEGGDALKKGAAEATVAEAKHISFFDNVGDAIGRFANKGKAMGVNFFGELLNPDSWKNGGWMGANGTLPGDDVPTPAPPKGQGPFGTYRGNYVEDPRETKRKQQEAKDHEIAMKHAEEQAKAETDAAQIRTESMESYLGRQQTIARLNKEIYDTQKKMTGNDATRTAELDKQKASLESQRKALMTEANLMTPDERRAETRADRKRSQAAAKADRQMKRELQEEERRVRTGARTDRKQITDRQNPFDRELAGEQKLANEKLDTIAALLAEMKEKSWE